MTRRATAFAGLLLLVWVWGSSSALAEPDAPAWCFRTNANGDLPTCTWDGTRWTRSYDSAVPAGGLPGGFVALMVLALLVGLAVTGWRVSTARKLAQRASMDTGQATALTLLEGDGLEATYMAANLRGQGLVTSEEYDERRRAILESL